MEHWSTAFLLNRIANHPHARQFAGDLACALAYMETQYCKTRSLDGVIQVSVDSRGATPCFPAEVSFVVTDRRSQTIAVSASAIYDGVLSGTPFALSASWGIPVLVDDPTMTFVPEAHGARDIVTSRANFVTMLDKAHRLLTEAWPASVSWLKCLVPAFITVLSPRVGLTLSGSFGPGKPIYLSCEEDEIVLSQNLVHELQHLRLGLCAMTEFAARWEEEQCIFISPYRLDARPLRGLHLGLHAFLAANELVLRLARNSATPASLLWQVVQTHQRNIFAYNTLKQHECFTTIGTPYLEELSSVIYRQNHHLHQVTTPASFREARRRTEKHIRSVIASTGGPLDNSATPLDLI